MTDRDDDVERVREDTDPTPDDTDPMREDADPMREDADPTPDDADPMRKDADPTPDPADSDATQPTDADAPEASTGAAGDGATEPPREGSSDRSLDVDRVVQYVQWGGLLALGLLAVIAGAGLYSSLSSTIDVWVAREYRPLARAAFNFAVLCVALAGILAVLGRVRPADGR